MLSKHFFLPLYLSMGPPPFPTRRAGQKYLYFAAPKEFRTVYLKDTGDISSMSTIRGRGPDPKEN